MKIFIILILITLYILLGISYISLVIYCNSIKKLSPLASLFGILLWPIGIIITIINRLKKK